jgi:hypothetical protein
VFLTDPSLVCFLASEKGRREWGRREGCARGVVYSGNYKKFALSFLKMVHLPYHT